MAETIEVEVGALHADLHEQMEGMLEEQYSAAMREQVEGMIHEYYQQVERTQEQNEEVEGAIEQKSDEA